ncbi:MAG: dihydrodipicolinate synthase family protein [Armatimonadetes bacterium]|nr:dihydrodipicolinate synthase family protein [Armatimonadota bacterium]
MTELEQYLDRIQPRRKIEGIAAALLPFHADGSIAEEAFAAHLQRTQAAGLTNAVNMDTGYANHLTDEEKERILRITRDALGRGTRFVAGAYVEGKDGDLVSLYRREIERIVEYGGTPILFQTSRLHDRPTSEKVDVYRRAVEGLDAALAFELGRMFAPNGEIFDEETVTGLMEIPELKGMKHSSLSVVAELKRLELRDRVRPDFKIYTGNDLGIDLVEFGSDYLLGLATFCPEAFAERDRLWEAGDPAYFEVSDAIQNLGNLAFRPPVPAYKHSAAIFLHLLGQIPTPDTHPKSATRPEWEPEIMRFCAERLGLV